MATPKRSWKKRTKSWSTRLAQDGFVEDSVLQSAIDEAKAVANVTKPVTQADVTDYSFLREAMRK